MVHPIKHYGVTLSNVDLSRFLTRSDQDCVGFHWPILHSFTEFGLKDDGVLSSVGCHYLFHQKIELGHAEVVPHCA